MSKFAWVGSLALVGLCMGGIACNASTEDEAGSESKNVDGTGTAGATTSKTINGLKYVSSKSSVPAPADSVDESFSDMKTCDTDMSYFQLPADAPHAAEINALLKGEANGPCESPSTYDSYQHVWAYDTEHHLLSVVTFANYYFAGAAHPSSGIFAQNFDLETGKLINLGDLLEDTAMPVLRQSMTNKIGAMKRMADITKEKRKLRSSREAIDSDIKESLQFVIDAETKEGQATPNDLSNFVIGRRGIRIDLSNGLPHALGGLPVTATAPQVFFTELDGHLKKTPILERIQKLTKEKDVNAAAEVAAIETQP